MMAELLRARDRAVVAGDPRRARGRHPASRAAPDRGRRDRGLRGPPSPGPLARRRAGGRSPLRAARWIWAGAGCCSSPPPSRGRGSSRCSTSRGSPRSSTRRAGWDRCGRRRDRRRRRRGARGPARPPPRGDPRDAGHAGGDERPGAAPRRVGRPASTSTWASCGAPGSCARPATGGASSTRARPPATRCCAAPDRRAERAAGLEHHGAVAEARARRRGSRARGPTRRPRSQVPLLEPRSTASQAPSSARSSRCRRETVGCAHHDVAAAAAPDDDRPRRGQRQRAPRAPSARAPARPRPPPRATSATSTRSSAGDRAPSARPRRCSKVSTLR